MCIVSYFVLFFLFILFLNFLSILKPVKMENKLCKTHFRQKPEPSVTRAVSRV